MQLLHLAMAVSLDSSSSMDRSKLEKMSVIGQAVWMKEKGVQDIYREMFEG